jgi:cytidylate kinase
LERDVAERDKRDSTREVAPLRRAEDAMSIDTTGMTIDEVVQAISKRVDAIASRLSEEGS